MKDFPTLYKKTSSGKTQMWTIDVLPQEGGTAIIKVTYGLVGGTLITQQKHILTGKNIGRSNETTPLDQAYADATSKWVNQRDRAKYDEDVELSALKRNAAPMLAQRYEDRISEISWTTAYAQPKLDGHRCLTRITPEKIVQISRGGNIIENLTHITDELRDAFNGHTITLDGEIYLQGYHVTTIGGWVAKTQPDTKRLQYHIYDIVDSSPFLDRFVVNFRNQFQTRLATYDFIQVVETVKVDTHEQLIEYRDSNIAKGLEGAMLRHDLLPYQNDKQSKSLLKVKKFEDAEFKVIGFKEGESTFTGMAIFLCEVKPRLTFDAVAPGTHEEKREYFRKGQDYIGRMLTVQYAGWTPDGKPFHPVALQFREDI